MKKICIFLFLFTVSFAMADDGGMDSTLISISGIGLQADDEDYLSFNQTDYFLNNTREPDWYIEMINAVEPAFTYGNSVGEPPYIMMAGYMDSEISWSEGGKFHMLAYVTDYDSSVESVELYYWGEPTGSYLYDDGRHGDFAAGDELWGLEFDVDPELVPEGDYLFELRAQDSDGNLSDIWPYLTIHPE